MLFNSIDFAIFLPVVFILYWLTRRWLKVQNLLIVIASYIFYGWWDWRFLSLIFVSTATDFLIGLGLEKEEHSGKRKLLLWTSIIVNIGILGFFKYYNFFVENVSSLFSFFGSSISVHSLHIILPVGISFYTFQTLSYTIDVYKKRLRPDKDFISFAAFVSFFPQLVAGPIERATNLLGQFHQKRKFTYEQAMDGVQQMIWGFFKKMVIADNCAGFANLIFDHPESYSGSTLVLGALFFAFQIYGDFSGYSDIAIGTARLFGFQLQKNFAYPYFSRDIAEFWRRWHISLTSWFRDYIYIPLGGSRGGTWKKIRNTFIIFLISGFWHGANWTFIVWGALNAVYFLPLLLTKRHRDHIEIVAKGRVLPSFKEFTKIITTFALTLFAWIFFRSESLAHAGKYIAGIFSKSLFTMPEYPGIFDSLILLFLIFIFMTIEWIGREKEYAIAGIAAIKNQYIKWVLYYLLIMVIFLFAGKEEHFIYFQF